MTCSPRIAAIVVALVAACAAPAGASAADKLVIRGAGFGHGVGMSQYGALGMAEQGWDHGRILALDTPASLKRSVGNGKGTTSTVRAWLTRLRAEARSVEPELDGGDGPLDDPTVEAALLEVVAAADRLGLNLDDVRRGVTLETVFFELTGRDLRE